MDALTWWLIGGAIYTAIACVFYGALIGSDKAAGNEPDYFAFAMGALIWPVSTLIGIGMMIGEWSEKKRLDK